MSQVNDVKKAETYGKNAAKKEQISEMHIQQSKQMIYLFILNVDVSVFVAFIRHLQSTCIVGYATAIESRRILFAKC